MQQDRKRHLTSLWPLVPIPTSQLDHDIKQRCSEHMLYRPQPCRPRTPPTYFVCVLSFFAEKSGGESEDARGDSEDDSQPADVEWVIFTAVWAFLLLNVGVYLVRSQE